MRGLRWMAGARHTGDRLDASDYTTRLLAAAVVAASLLAASSCSHASVPARNLAGHALQVARPEEVRLVPSLEAGWAGWCMTRDGETSSTSSCFYTRSRSPIVAESWRGGGPPPVANGVALTTSKVVAVSLEGRSPLLTHPEPALPGGLRAVVVEIRGKESPFPRFRPLDARGEPMPVSAQPGPALGIEMPSRALASAESPTRGSCRIRAAYLRGLTVTGGRVLSSIGATRRLLGRAFLTCASTEYDLDNWPLRAAVLLDAALPQGTPSAIPAMRPVQGHTGIFRAPGPEGELLGRRLPHAWLVVASGHGMQQRLTLLEHLRARVQL